MSSSLFLLIHDRFSFGLSFTNKLLQNNFILIILHMHAIHGLFFIIRIGSSFYCAISILYK